MNGPSLGDRIADRLKSLAKARKLNVEGVLVRYVGERLLHRLEVAGHAQGFCLKGAMSLVARSVDGFVRPTEDMDLNGFDPACDMEAAKRKILDAATAGVEDGLEFDVASLMVRKEHVGVVPGGKIEMDVTLGRTRVRARVDVGFGNAFAPAHAVMTIETLLDLPRPTIGVYPVEATIAEKLNAALSFGADSTRIKDLYDLLTLSRRPEGFDGAILAASVKATLTHQRTAIPEGTPPALSDAFAAARKSAWNKYLSHRRLSAPPIEQAVAEVRAFVMPVLEAVRDGTEPPSAWSAGGGWEARPTLQP